MSYNSSRKNPPTEAQLAMIAQMCAESGLHANAPKNYYEAGCRIGQLRKAIAAKKRREHQQASATKLDGNNQRQ